MEIRVYSLLSSSVQLLNYCCVSRAFSSSPPLRNRLILSRILSRCPGERDCSSCISNERIPLEETTDSILSLYRWFRLIKKCNEIGIQFSVQIERRRDCNGARGVSAVFLGASRTVSHAAKPTAISRVSAYSRKLIAPASETRTFISFKNKRIIVRILAWFTMIATIWPLRLSGTWNFLRYTLDTFFQSCLKYKKHLYIFKFSQK